MESLKLNKFILTINKKNKHNHTMRMTYKY